MASIVGSDPAAFLGRWRNLSPESVLGRIDTKQRIRLTLAGLGMAAPQEIVEQMARIEQREQQAAVLFDGAVDVLAQLRGTGYKLGLVSNLSHAARYVPDRLGIRDLFDVIVLSFEVGLAKPDPAIYTLAVERLGISPRVAAFVGDGNDAELDGARCAGLATIMVAQARNSLLRNAESRHFDARVERLTDVPAAIVLVESGPRRAGSTW
jgi:putative hydrolase of the HAD superfamily